METTKLLPHQQRVVDEKHELSIKYDKLTDFMKGTLFNTLPIDEQERLKHQHNIMYQYCSVLSERIAHFN